MLRRTNVKQLRLAVRVLKAAAHRAAVCVALPACMALMPSPASANRGSISDSAVHAVNAFTCDLYAQVAAERGNIILSPFSIQTAFAVAHAGARGKTAAQISKALHLPKQTSQLGMLVKALNEQTTPGCDIVIATGLFAQSGYQFEPRYKETIHRDFDAEFSELDMTGWPGMFDPIKATLAREEINSWITRQTRGTIHAGIPDSLPNVMTRCVLANAICFHGTWETPFPKSKTRDLPFYPDADTTVTVPTMQLASELYYGDTPSLQVLGLPYKSNRLTFFVLLPKQDRTLDEIEKSLTPGRIDSLARSVRRREVHVTLPRFKAESQVELRTVLKELGMSDAFSPEADFSGITTEGPFFLQAAMHTACVKVDEEGTKAAGATVLSFSTLGFDDPPPRFQADRPFLFFIRDQRSGAVLFMGRIVDPTR